MQLWGSLHLVGPVSALLTVLAFIHLSRSSSPASSSSHLFHQWSRGSPRATSSSTTKATAVHAPAATEATSVSTTAASEHSTRTTAVHEATSSSPHASRATSAAVTAWGDSAGETLSARTERWAQRPRAESRPSASFTAHQVTVQNWRWDRRWPFDKGLKRSGVHLHINFPATKYEVQYYPICSP